MEALGPLPLLGLLNEHIGLALLLAPPLLQFPVAAIFLRSDPRSLLPLGGALPEAGAQEANQEWAGSGEAGLRKVREL